jgi:hypothetical protein
MSSTIGTTNNHNGSFGAACLAKTGRPAIEEGTDDVELQHGEDKV